MAWYGSYEACILIILLMFLFCLTAGWGQLARQILGLQAENFWGLDGLWLGLIFLIMALGLAHFFIPINWLMRSGVMLVALLGFVSVKNLRRQILVLFTTLLNHPIRMTIFTAGLIMLCLKSLQAPNSFDSALYHFQTIRWLNEYAIVPGLGNLHGRLAFNQSYFNFLAFLDIQPIASKGYAAAGLFILALCMASLLSLCRRLNAGRTWVAVLLTLGVASNLDLLRSPTPDLAVALLQIQLFICLAVLVNTDQSDFSERLTRVVLSLFIACLICTVKISALAYALGAIAVLLPFCSQIPKAMHPVLIRTGVICFGFLCIHLARGYMLSGAPLFPSMVGALPSLPWAMLPDNIRGEADWIYSWARMPGVEPSAVLGNWSWLDQWWVRRPSSFLYVAGLSVSLFVMNVILLLRQRQNSRVLMHHALYLPLIFSIIFWFFTAPDFRFLGSIPILLITLGGWLMAQHLYNLSPTSRRWFLELAGASAIIVSVCASAIFLYFTGVRSLTLSVPEHLPSVKASAAQFRSGQIFYQPQDGLCWDSALPCTPFVYPDLKLLVPDLGISGGFTLK